MYCKHCGREIKEGSAFCQYCGTPTGGTREEPPKKKKAKGNGWKIFAGIFAISAFVGATAGAAVTGYKLYQEKILVRQEETGTEILQEEVMQNPAEEKAPVYMETHTGPKTKRYAYFLDENGKRVYDYVEPFKKGEATVARSGREYMIVDKRANRICEKSYDYIEGPDRNGNFVVRQGTDLGLVSAEGKEIIEPSYTLIKAMDGNHTDKKGVYLFWDGGKSGVITDNKECLIEEQDGQVEVVSMKKKRYQINLEGGETEIRDFEGNVIVSGGYGELSLYTNGCIWDAVDRNVLDWDGNVLLSQEDENGVLQQVECFFGGELGDGIAYTRGADEMQAKKGLFTFDGKTEFPCVYNQLYCIPDKNVIFYSGDQKAGVMDKNGKLLWESDYDFGYVFLTKDKMGTADEMLVKKGGNYGLVDIKSGKMLLECQYSYISKDSRRENSWFWQKDGKSGFWNQEEKKKTEIPYRGTGTIEGFHAGSDSDSIYVYDYSMGDFLRIHEEKGIGVIDREGNYVITPGYSSISYDEYNELFLAETESQSCVLNLKGQIIVPWGSYDEILWDSNLICAETEDVTYCFDHAGNYVATSEDGVKNLLEEGFIAIPENGKYLLKSSDGSIVRELDYEWVSASIEDGLLLVKDHNGKHGYINTDGEEMIPCVYEDGARFEYGLAPVANLSEYDKKWGLINIKGERIVAFDYDDIEFCSSHEVIKVRSSEVEVWGAINIKDEWITTANEEIFTKGSGEIHTVWRYDETSWEGIYDFGGRCLDAKEVSDY